MPSTAYLILSEVEGRTTPMQCSKMCACPSACAGAMEARFDLKRLYSENERQIAPAAICRSRYVATNRYFATKTCSHSQGAPCQSAR